MSFIIVYLNHLHPSFSPLHLQISFPLSQIHDFFFFIIVVCTYICIYKYNLLSSFRFRLDYLGFFFKQKF